MTWRTSALVASLGCALASQLPAQTASFTPLPYSNGFFSPFGISADGHVVVGEAYTPSNGYRARRWRDGIGFDDPGPTQGATRSAAYCVSADGLTMGGSSGHAQFGDLEGWMRYGNSTGHVGSPPGHDTSDCLALSRDGAVTVGYGGVQSNPNLFQAAYYTEQDDWTNLGFLPGGDNSKATAVDDDGSVIAGWSNDSSYYYSRAWRWTQAGGMVSLGSMPNGGETKPTGMNSDGSVIVGYDYVTDVNWVSHQAAWRWTQATGFVDLGFLPGGTDSYASAVSADGSIVVGASSTNGGWRAFVWDAAHGMVDLQQLLVAQGVLAVAGDELTSANAIAGSGPYLICGEGVGATANYGGWKCSISSLDAGPSITSFCFGNAANGAPCPCNNFGASGAGCVNSSGVGAVLSASGSTSVANDDLVLTATQLPPNKAGLLFMGSSPLNGGLGTPFGDGLRCMSGPYRRFPLSNSGPTGSFALSSPVAASGGLIADGDAWIFQAWYRDPTGPCAQGTNLSNAVLASFAP